LSGRSLWAALHLLDRQVLDRDALPVAKVDDLDFAPSAEPDGLPILTDILCGQAAHAQRFHPRVARALELLRRVIEPVPEPGPARIPWVHVGDVDTAVHLSADRHEFAVTVFDTWLAREVLSRVPGSGVTREHDR
jgi:hypothetical protein